MTSGLSTFEAEYEQLLAQRRLEQRTGRMVDAVLLGGVLLALVLASTDPRALGVADDSALDLAIIVAQRLSVFLPLGVGLLFAVPILPVLRRVPLAVFVAFSAWALVAASFVDQPLGEIDRAVWFLSFVLLVVMTTVRIGWERVVAAVAAVGAAYVLIGLVAHVLGLLPTASVEFFDGRLFGLDRVRGLAAQENTFGRAAAYVALLGLILLTSAETSRRRPLAAASLAIGLAGVLASQSRFALISLFFAGLIVLARHVVGARVPAALLVVAAGAGIGLILITGSLGPFARTDEPGEATSLFGRTEVWEQAVQTTIDEPLFGIGTEGLTRRYLQLDDAGVYDWNPTNAHSVVLQTSASHGVIGSGLMIAALLVGLVYAVRSSVAGAFEVLVMFGIQGFVESILIGNPAIAPMMLIGALTALTVERDGIAEDE